MEGRLDTLEHVVPLLGAEREDGRRPDDDDGDDDAGRAVPFRRVVVVVHPVHARKHHPDGRVCKRIASSEAEHAADPEHVAVASRAGDPVLPLTHRARAATVSAAFASVPGCPPAP